MIACGLATGSSDLIGLTPVLITDGMVGQTIGVFTAIEVKTSNGRASKEQLTFIDAITKNGGYAGIARNEKDAIDIITKQD